MSSVEFGAEPLPAAPAGTPQSPTFVVEVARGAKRFGEFVRTFLAGEPPPAFQQATVAFQFMGPSGETPPPAESVDLDVAGPVAVAIAEGSAGDVPTLRLWLRDPAAGPVAVRLYRGWEGAERPPEPVAAFALSAAQPTVMHPLGADYDAVRVEVQPPQ